MFEIEFLSHNSITKNQLDEIISIKSIAWPYSYESQLTWLSNNLKKDDKHALLYLNGSLVAYLNLIRIRLSINGISRSGYGIGNVCAKERGKGWGVELIVRTNFYITKLNYLGLLFCKKELVNFYMSNNWNLIEKEKIRLLFENEYIETMSTNVGEVIELVEYLGTPF